MKIVVVLSFLFIMSPCSASPVRQSTPQKHVTQLTDAQSFLQSSLISRKDIYPLSKGERDEVIGQRNHRDHVRDLSRALGSRYYPHNHRPMVNFSGHQTDSVLASLVSRRTLSKQKAILPESEHMHISTRQLGFTGDICSSTSDCTGNRICSTLDSGTRVCLPTDALVDCTSNSDCVVGERCFERDGRDFCLSETAFQTPTSPPPTSPPPTRSPPTRPPPTRSPPTRPPVAGPPVAEQPVAEQPVTEQPVTEPGDGISEPCISVNALRHLSRTQLVFENDLLANVLCDDSESCATPGHMVSYHGSGMMMKSYCELIGGCTRKVMLVNSPKYEHRLMVASKSDGLLFTPFSARYETQAEEGMLSFAIRFGL